MSWPPASWMASRASASASSTRPLAREASRGRRAIDARNDILDVCQVLANSTEFLGLVEPLLPIQHLAKLSGERRSVSTLSAPTEFIVSGAQLRLGRIEVARKVLDDAFLPSAVGQNPVQPKFLGNRATTLEVARAWSNRPARALRRPCRASRKTSRLALPRSRAHARYGASSCIASSISRRDSSALASSPRLALSACSSPARRA